MFLCYIVPRYLGYNKIKAYFDEMAILFGLNNLEEHINYLNYAYYERQTQNMNMIRNPFALTDCLFIKKSSLTKDIVKNVRNLLSFYIMFIVTMKLTKLYQIYKVQIGNLLAVTLL